MNVGRCTLLFLAAGFFAGLGPASFGEEQPPNWDALFAQLTALDWGQSLAPLQPIERAVQQAQVSGEPSQATMLEERLLNALRDADHRAAKDYICRQLARIGTAAAVPELSQLLDDEQLAHPARVALEAIPDETAVTALRLALERVDGRRQTGIMQSLGTLRDADAVPRLVELLRDADPEVAAAAAMALGRIGTHEAAQSLDTWDETSSVPRATRIDARRIAAEQQLPRGETGEVAKLARRWSSVEPTHVRVMAFRLLLEAEPAEAEAQLEGALAGEDRWLRAAAADWVRDHATAGQVESLAGQLAHLPPAGQARLLPALAANERSPDAVRRAALEALRHTEPQVRRAAVECLPIVGTAEDVRVLADLASRSENSAEERDAAFLALCRLRTPATDASIRTRIEETADDDLQSTLFRSLAERRSFQSVPLLLTAAENSEGKPRLAALLALQQLGNEQTIPALLRLVPQTQPGPEREAADRALWLACQRISEPPRGTDLLLQEISRSDAETRCALLPTLGRLGGEPALQAIQAALQDPDPKIQEAAIRAFANWPDASVADKLLQLAREAPNPTHRVWALRGFARVVPIKGARTDVESVQLLSEALSVAERVEDQQLVLSRLATVRIPESLAVVMQQLDQPTLVDAAAQAAYELANAMRRSHPQVSRAALEEIRRRTDDATLHGRIDQLLWYLSRQTPKP